MVTTFTFVNHLLELGVTSVNCPKTVGKLSNTISRTNYWFIASLVPKPLWCSLRLPLRVAQMPCPSTIGCWCRRCPTSNMIHPHWTLRQIPCVHIRQKKHNSVTKIWLQKTLSMLDLTINPEQRAYNKRCRTQAQNMPVSVQTQTVTGALYQSSCRTLPLHTLGVIDLFTVTSIVGENPDLYLMSIFLSIPCIKLVCPTTSPSEAHFQTQLDYGWIPSTPIGYSKLMHTRKSLQQNWWDHTDVSLPNKLPWWENSNIVHPPFYHTIQ